MPVDPGGIHIGISVITNTAYVSGSQVVREAVGNMEEADGATGEVYEGLGWWIT